MLNYHILNKTEKSFLVLIWVYFFHLLRNINMLIYVGVLLLAIFNVIVHGGIKGLRIRFLNSYEKVFSFLLAIMPFISIINGISIKEFIIGFSRYLITTSFFFLLLYYKDNLTANFVRTIYISFVIFMMLTAFSIFYQIKFGAVSFFAMPSERAGLTRYASLAGSLTTFGTLGIFACIILLYLKEYFSNIFRYFALVSIILGMCLTLQKAAVVNIIFLFLLHGGWCLLHRKKQGIVKFFFIIFFFLIFGGIVIQNSDMNSGIGRYIETTISYTFNGSTNYLGTEADLMDRLFGFPISAYYANNLNVINLFIGKGFVSLAGILGLDNYAMSHNQFFEMVYSGGFVYLLSYLFWIINTMKKDSRCMFTWSTGILILCNMMMGALSFFQPIAGIIVFTFLLFGSGSMSRKEMEEDKISEQEQYKKKAYGCYG